MKIYLTNVLFTLSVYCVFWLVPYFFCSENVQDWVIYISLAIGVLIIIGGGGLLAQGETDGRFRSGYKNNITPDMPGGVMLIYFGINILLIGWGLSFILDEGLNVVKYVIETEWMQMSLFIYIFSIITLINGFMVPASDIFYDE